MLAAKAASDLQADDIVILDLKKLTSFTDYFVICGGRSDRQVRSIAEAVEKNLKGQGIHPLGVEGEGEGHWVLMDYGSVVVHVFYHEVREYYSLEKLWSDAETVCTKNL